MSGPPRFDLTHLLWYTGALLVMTGMGVFTTLAFSALGGRALAVIGCAYALAFTLAGRALWRRGLTTPGGLLIAVAVSMAPLVVYGAQAEMVAWIGDAPGAYRDVYRVVGASFVPMELATIAAALVALWRYPVAFIVMVLAVALWFLSMDLAVWLRHGAPDVAAWEVRRLVSLGFGGAMGLVAWRLDLSRDRSIDAGFWLHLFGALALWGALSAGHADDLGAALGYGAINVGFLLVSVYLRRRVYAVLGALGLSYDLGLLASGFFRDTLTFTAALTALGAAVLALGLIYHRHRAWLAATLDRLLPRALRALRPPP